MKQTAKLDLDFSIKTLIWGAFLMSGFLRLICVVCLLTGLPGVGLCDVGGVAAVHGYGSGAGDLPYTDSTVFDPTGGLLEQSGSGSGNGIQTVAQSVQLVGGTTFNSFVKMKAEAESNKNGLDVPDAYSVAVFSWTDQIHLIGTNTKPDFVRVTISAEGEFSHTTVGPYPQSEFRHSFTMHEATGAVSEELFASLRNTDCCGFASIQYQHGNPDQIQAHGSWQGSVSEFSFDGSAGYNVPLNIETGTYDFKFLFETIASAQSASSSTLLGNSISLESVTDVNGNQLSGFSVGFASGRTIAVPGDFDLGDINLDGVVDFLDISPFIAILSAGGFQAEADVDQNEVVDFLDISPFIDILSQ